tara:strand:- start:212 stop:544 length:333 start_codon:yes stop_codon:yes gene_type:complete
MADFKWCHGPSCHTNETVDRIRGSKGNKVLRTKKVTNRYSKSMYGNGGASIWDFFCNHRCLMDYMAKHTQAVINIEPRREPLETKINDPVKNTEYRYPQWIIEKKVVDNA